MNNNYSNSNDITCCIIVITTALIARVVTQRDPHVNTSFRGCTKTAFHVWWLGTRTIAVSNGNRRAKNRRCRMRTFLRGPLYEGRKIRARIQLCLHAGRKVPHLKVVGRNVPVGTYFKRSRIQNKIKLYHDVIAIELESKWIKINTHLSNLTKLTDWNTNCSFDYIKHVPALRVRPSNSNRTFGRQNS